MKPLSLGMGHHYPNIHSLAYGIGNTDQWSFSGHKTELEISDPSVGTKTELAFFVQKKGPITKEFFPKKFLILKDDSFNTSWP